MSFFEVEFPRAIQFQRVGGQTFNTAVVATQSGQEQRNRAWAFARAEYTAGLVTPVSEVGDKQGFIDNVRNFFLQVGGMADGFRFFDHVDCVATSEPMVLVSGSVWQLQKTYSLGGRSYVRAITKPITSSVLDYKGNALANTVAIVSGGTLVSVDHSTGKVTLSGVSGTPVASCKYHIPVRFTSDKFEPEIEESGVSGTGAIIKWNSLGLIEVRPPNY
jgi:uncharacterized protein (TIGR02217 family)